MVLAVNITLHLTSILTTVVGLYPQDPVSEATALAEELGAIADKLVPADSILSFWEVFAIPEALSGPLLVTFFSGSPEELLQAAFVALENNQVGRTLVQGKK